MHQIKIHGSIDLSRCGKHGKCIKSKFMGQSICLAVGSTENASNQNSWVNGFVSLWEARKMHQIKIPGSIDLSRCGKHGKSIKSENSWVNIKSKFMGQSICLAVGSTENASNLKIQNSWVNRFVSLGKRGKCIKSKFMGQSICLAVGSTEKASNLKIQNSWVNRFVSLGKRGKCIKSKFMGQSICLAVGSTEN